MTHSFRVAEFLPDENDRAQCQPLRNRSGCNRNSDFVYFVGLSIPLVFEPPSGSYEFVAWLVLFSGDRNIKRLNNVQTAVEFQQSNFKENDVDIKTINEMIKRESAFVDTLTAEVGKVIVGQKGMVDRLLIGLLCQGHILLEGVPGLAKTLSIKTLAAAISAKFQRIQFTPDLLPADLVGTMIYNQKDGKFLTRKGPIFANFILADEINRAPAKVQSALLEAMQERQVTIGEETFKLEEPFLVLATQNPIEQEGTYPLPEAQVDRFMLKVKINYPSREEELLIMKQNIADEQKGVKATTSPKEILAARDVVRQVYMDEKIERYILDIVFATRQPKDFKLEKLAPLISYGASPRATINLAMASKAHAFIKRRGYVIPEDVRAICPDVLRHRVAVTYEAEAEEITSETIVAEILNHVEVP
jgi:MoxR-like ATPase